MTANHAANRRTVLKTIGIVAGGGFAVDTAAADTASFVDKAWSSTEVANIEAEVGALTDQGVLNEIQKTLTDGRSMHGVRIQTDNGELSYAEGYDEYGTVTSTSAQLVDYAGPSSQVDIIKGDGLKYRLLSDSEQSDAVGYVDEPNAAGAYVPSMDNPYRITGVPDSNTVDRSFYEDVDIATDDDGGSGGGGDHFEDPLNSAGSTGFTTQDECFGEDAEDVYASLSLACMLVGLLNPYAGIICGAAVIALEYICSEEV